MKKHKEKDDSVENAIQKCKEEMHETVSKIHRDLLGTLKILENRVAAQDEEIARLKKRPAKMEKEMEEWKAEKEVMWAEIEALKKEISTLKELVDAKTRGGLEEGEIQPSVIEELKAIREQVQVIKEDEKQHEAKTSTWVEVNTKTQKKMDEAEKWIEVTKKGKGKETATATPTIMNMTLDEEQRRRSRALHVRVTGLKDRDNVDEEVRELMELMGVDEFTHTKAWRVGKRGGGMGETSTEPALIMRFSTIEAKKEFLKKRPTLKKTGIFLGDDLTLSQIAHMKEVMPEIRAAREKGKTAFYREGRVVIMERRST